MSTVGPGVWRRAQAALGRGRGDELASKLRAPHSSSALAVNAFAPLLEDVDLPGPLRVRGPITFEQQRSAWAGGYPPTLDVIVEEEHSPIRLFVESKCTEFLRGGETAFSSAFVKHARQHLEPEAVETFERLEADGEVFDPLDARQLAKHFLAAKRAAVDASCTFGVRLLCVWWEPANASAHPVFRRHRHAVRAFAGALPDPQVEVVGHSYRDLWDTGSHSTIRASHATPRIFATVTMSVSTRPRRRTECPGDVALDEEIAAWRNATLLPLSVLDEQQS